MAVVVDGAVRDPVEIRATGILVYARATTPVPSTGLGPGYVNVPVVIGGVIVYPSDVIVADEEAIVVIPARDIERVVAFAEAKTQAEARVVVAVRINEATASHPLPIEAPTAVAEPGPYLLNVKVTPFENVYPMVPAGGAINEMVMGPPQPVALPK